MGARRWGRGARIGVHHPSSKIKHFFLLYGWPFSYLFSTWGPFMYVFLSMGALFTMRGHFCSPFLHVGAFFATLFYFFYLWRPFSPCEGLSAPLFSMWGGGGLFCSHGEVFYGRARMHICYNTVMLKCINIQIYKITVITPTHINYNNKCSHCCEYVLRMSLHQIKFC